MSILMTDSFHIYISILNPQSKLRPIYLTAYLTSLLAPSTVTSDGTIDHSFPLHLAMGAPKILKPNRWTQKKPMLITITFRYSLSQMLSPREKPISTCQKYHILCHSALKPVFTKPAQLMLSLYFHDVTSYCLTVKCSPLQCCYPTPQSPLWKTKSIFSHPISPQTAEALWD